MLRVCSDHSQFDGNEYTILNNQFNTDSIEQYIKHIVNC